jgi:hypothetical protein
MSAPAAERAAEPPPLWSLVDDLAAPLRTAIAWALLLDQVVSGELRFDPVVIADPADYEDALRCEATNQLLKQLQELRAGVKALTAAVERPGAAGA